MANLLKRVLFLVNGTPQSAMGHRARALASHLQNRLDLHLCFRSSSKLQSIWEFRQQIHALRPHVVYVFDMAYSGVLAGILARLEHRSKLIVDTGDAIAALAKAVGRGRLGCWLTRALEFTSLQLAQKIVVRGSYHRDWLLQKKVAATWIPDGVEMDLFQPLEVSSLRKELQLQDSTTIGLVGSVIWNPKQQSCYGMELVDVIHQLQDRPVQGILIGGGTGLPILQERCQKLGIEKRIRFLGPIPYEQLPSYLNAMDICLSTQSNDLPGQVRTTGKLPLYMACGRFVLATRVGEAARVLPEAMLIDYSGSFDPEYPQRLAQRIASILDQPSLLELGQTNRDVARTYFDYPMLAERVYHLIDAL